MRDAILISYRRADAMGASGRVYDWLKIGFEAGAVFRDVHSIGVGRWRDRIAKALSRCAVCVAVIGPRWADATNLPRLHQADDVVRWELEAAMASEAITIVPTLVENAVLAEAGVEQLPKPLQPLLREWNIRSITENGWEDDIRRLIKDIADATGLAVQQDFPTLLESVAAAERRVAALEEEQEAKDEELEASRRTIAELRSRLADASTASSERHRLAEAFAALAEGDTRKAEAAFEREHKAALRTAVDSATHVANLAMLRDVGKAADYFATAVRLDPTNAAASLQRGEALLSLGDRDGAVRALCHALEQAKACGDGALAVSALLGLAICEFKGGQGEVALGHDREALAKASALVDADPSDPNRLRSLSVCQATMGDHLLEMGRSSEALEAYQQGLSLREGLAERNPADAQAQRDLANALERIGEIRLARGNFEVAAETFQRLMAIREHLVQDHPANNPWRHDLAIAHNKLGNARFAVGDALGALNLYERGIEIMAALVTTDPANHHWQRGLAVGHNHRGEAQEAMGHQQAALEDFQQGLEITENLCQRDPANSSWQSDLAISLYRIGGILLLQGDRNAALKHYQQAMEIRRSLVEVEPRTSPWIRDLFVSHVNLAETLQAIGKAEQAEANFRDALALADTLLAKNPEDPQTRLDHAEVAYKLYALISTTSHRHGENNRALLNTSLATVRELLALGWPVPNEAWVRELDVEGERQS
jgi:tetratricopeptide (TPR) repeat protein